ncbi:MAG: DUF2309 domain-containing protein [Pirellulaceae bacterium]
MLQLAPERSSAQADTSPTHLADRPAAERFDDLLAVLADIESVVPPLWPLKDYVAVNPLLGLSQHRFLAARQWLRGVRDCELLPPASYFRDLLERGEITQNDVEAAYRQSFAEYPELYSHTHPAEMLHSIETGEAATFNGERRYRTVAEVVDHGQGGSWTSHILNDISRHCAAHFDQGQASWPSPWKHLPLYEAWREAAQVSRRMDQLGVHGFRSLVGTLPADPAQATAQLLAVLEIPREHWHGFLLCQLLSIAGWAGFVKYRVREAEQAGLRNDDLTGLLAIRLAYDAALLRSQTEGAPPLGGLCPLDGDATESATETKLAPPVEVLARYTLQVAVEIAYRRRLFESLTADRGGVAQASGRKTAQMIFCIDVRSEVMRRHLEAASDELETFGFAGFFGMPLEYVPLGEAHGSAQCPVLLTPGFRVREGLLGAGGLVQARVLGHRRVQRAWRKLWKSFQTSATSCFSFVESLGLLYFGKLLTDSLRMTRPSVKANEDGAPPDGRLSLGPDLDAPGEDPLPLAQRLDLAEGMLRNLGLTDGFARIVVVCGHAAEVVNNPYKAGLDCGACGGHSGEPNARVAAALLNDPRVRSGLARRGIDIPEDTWFAPAVHNTTTDEIRFFDIASMPETHADEFEHLRNWTGEAGERCRLERGKRLGGAAAEDLLRRSRDWSEVRPEWGLAGNAAFVVAPRSRTAGLDLGGRTFLHSYDYRKDPESKVLELIMTAPMIVTNWINLQYFASAVDNRAFGSGNKVIHDVVGQLGVLLGNGGDLMTGLPWQSVHDGERYQHPPLRLTVVIEAPRRLVQKIVEKHSMVRELVENGWLSLVVLETEQFHRWTADGWVLEDETPLASATPKLHAAAATHTLTKEGSSS